MVNAKAARAVVGGGGCGEKGRQWERVQEVSVCVCGPEVQFSVGDPATAPTVLHSPFTQHAWREADQIMKAVIGSRALSSVK